ncbi:hypothetical protein D7X48_15995, partial [bacterium D16-50]
KPTLPVFMRDIGFFKLFKCLKRDILLHIPKKCKPFFQIFSKNFANIFSAESYRKNKGISKGAGQEIPASEIE